MLPLSPVYVAAEDAGKTLEWTFFSAPQQVTLDCGENLTLWWDAAPGVMHDVDAIAAGGCTCGPGTTVWVLWAGGKSAREASRAQDRCSA